MTENQVASEITFAATTLGSTITLRGEIDAALRDQASAAMARLAGTDGPVTIDVSDVSFIDSSGLAFLLQVYMLGKEAGTAVSLRDPSTELLELLDMIGMGGTIPVVRSHAATAV